MLHIRGCFTLGQSSPGDRERLTARLQLASQETGVTILQTPDTLPFQSPGPRKSVAKTREGSPHDAAELAAAELVCGARERRVPPLPEGQGAVGHRSRAIPTWPREDRGTWPPPAPPAARSPARGAPPRLPAQPRPPPSPARVRVPPPSPPPRAVGEGPRHLSPTGRENKAAAARTFFGVCSALPQATTYRSGFGRFGESRRAPASASPSRSGSSARLHGPRTVPPARRPRAPSSRPPSPSRLQAGGRGAGARGRGRAARAGPAGSCSFPLRAVEGLAPPGRKGRRGPPRSWTPL